MCYMDTLSEFLEGKLFLFDTLDHLVVWSRNPDFSRIMLLTGNMHLLHARYYTYITLLTLTTTL